jgi:hypothetical protein
MNNDFNIMYKRYSDSDSDSDSDRDSDSDSDRDSDSNSERHSEEMPSDINSEGHNEDIPSNILDLNDYKFQTDNLKILPIINNNNYNFHNDNIHLKNVRTCEEIPINSNLNKYNCVLLNENSPQLSFTHLNIKLYQHQQSLLYKINEMEENIEKSYNENYININSKQNNLDMYIQSNIGIICDMVGSGKTYTLLSQILRKPLVNHCSYKILTSKPLVYNKISQNFHLNSICAIQPKKVLNINLIIVPNGVYTQWTNYLKKFLVEIYENINVKYIFGNKSFINNVDKELEDIMNEKYQIILASSNYWNLYFKKYLVNSELYNSNDYLISRVIIDEVDTIDIGKRTDITLLPSSFYWFISSNYENLFHPNGKRNMNNNIYDNFSYNQCPIVNNFINVETQLLKSKNQDNIRGFMFMNYLKSFFSGFDKEKFSKIFILNDPNWIKKSIQMPNINYYEYFAIDEIEEHIENLIKYGGCEKIVNYLNCNDWDGLSYYTNCNVKNPNDLYTYLMKELDIQIENRQIEIEYRKKLKNRDTINNREIQEYQNKINKLEEQCNSLKVRKDTIKNNINNINNDDCLICADKLKHPVFVRCCYHHYCTECLMNYFKSTNQTQQNCPLCRQEINKNMMFFIKDYKQFDNLNENILTNNKDLEQCNQIHKTKFEILYDIINNIKIIRNDLQRILIFIDKNSVFDKIVNDFKNKNIPFGKLNGSIYQMNKIINKYFTGEIPILLLNACSYGTGINLHNTTDIILLNRMDRCLESQIIGRAQRIGRNIDCSLNVHYIMYRNEKFLDKTYYENKL